MQAGQATRGLAAPLSHGVKSTGVEPGGTARMCQPPAKCGYYSVDLRTVSLLQAWL